FGHAVRECPFLVLMLVATWFVFPFAAASVVFPSDVIGFQDWMQGAPIRRFYTQQSLYSGIAMATMALALMGLIQLNLTTLIYRKVNEFALFWPVALFLIAGVANGLWWLRTGYFDFTGALIGCTPFLSAVAWQAVCEKLGG